MLLLFKRGNISELIEWEIVVLINRNKPIFSDQAFLFVLLLFLCWLCFIFFVINVDYFFFFRELSDEELHKLTETVVESLHHLIGLSFVIRAFLGCDQSVVGHIF